MNAERDDASRARFHSTRWSVVLAARSGESETAARALAELCETYWYPVYAFIRRGGRQRADAEDLTQGFFASLLERAGVDGARREKGRFRSYLLGALEHFLADDRDREQALKRGGGRRFFSLEPDLADARYGEGTVVETTPERLFEKEWALALLDAVLGRLEAEYKDRGKEEQFRTLRSALDGGLPRGSYPAVAESLGTTEGNVKVLVHRLRGRYRQLLREEVAGTVATSDEVDEEIGHLFEVLADG